MADDAQAEAPPDRAQDARTAINGLDDVLSGGFARGFAYLLEGLPGTGKTTLALRFLMEGARVGERVLYVTLSETARELYAAAGSHGWSLDGVTIHELVPPEDLLDENQKQSLLYSSDLELAETTREIFRVCDELRPDRVVLDSLAELVLLAQGPLRYRRQMMALKHYFAGLGATVLLLDDLTAAEAAQSVHSIAHGVIRLEELAPVYGAERRRLRVVKYRGRRYRGGFHDFAIRTGRVEVFPRLVSSEHRAPQDRGLLSTDNAALDRLLGGGVEAGSGVLILGPAGTGKSLLGLTFAEAAMRRGERAAMFVFDEELGILADRALGFGIDVRARVAEGLLSLEQVDAAELTPGELATRVRHQVEERRVATVIIDSLNGYQAAMPGEEALVLHMHELLQFMNRQGVTSFLTVAQHGLVGDMRAPVDVTYLADTVILLRYFEAMGRVLRAMSVVKKRAGPHEDTIREYRIGRSGLRLGEPLMSFQGVLRGTPVLLGDGPALLGDDPLTGPAEGAAP